MSARKATRELPGGTLTFLFSDIEGSTRLIDQLGGNWTETLDDHHRLLREAMQRHGGIEIATEGDSFFVAFATAPAAISAAADAQRAIAAHTWPQQAAIRVRMGLHSGTASLAGGSYTGIDVHRAARIMSAAHGGQVVLSSATRALLGDSLPPGLALRDLGRHRLRDLASADTLHQLIIEGLPADFPPLRALVGSGTNVPDQRTSFLGRERELNELVALVERSRLVTLTGPGGTGKTRLAVEAARRLMDAFPDGVWFVALAAIAEPDLVAPTIAKTLDVPEQHDRSDVERIIGHLDGRRMLLVLDNFEQVIDAASVTADLLAGAHGLTILVTSRSVLNVYGEQEYAVPPLTLPDLRRLPETSELTQVEAVALFVERARAARPAFALDARTAPVVAEICVRLDGLPLAIELAAARVRVLPPEAILQRLGDRLGLLAGGPRDLPERQRTLRGAIEWSHDLLDEPDRRLFACLSVFVGGASLDAVSAICRDVAVDALDGLSSLVDKSLLRQVGDGTGEPRFAMLETIREFAVERSLESGAHDELRSRHARWFADLAADLAPKIMGPDQRRVLDRLEQEQPNMRASIAWAIENGQADLALLLTSRLWRMWQMRGYLAEGLERVTQALALPGSSGAPLLRADALEAAGGLAYWSGNMPETRRWYEQALSARRALGDPAGVAEALYNLAFSFVVTEPGAAPDDVATARRLTNEAMTLFSQLGNSSGEGRTLWLLSGIDMVDGDFAAVEDKGRRAEEAFRRLGDRFYLGWTLWSVAIGQLGLNRPEQARRPVREAIEIFRQVGDVSGLIGLFDLAAKVALETGDRTRAARLSGIVAGMEEATGIDLNRVPRAALNFDPQQLRTDADMDAAWQEGTRMEMNEAITYALEGLAEDPPTHGAAARLSAAR